MPIRAIILDIGGVLELSRDGGEPTAAFRALIAAWEARLGLSRGALGGHLEHLREGGLLGHYSEADWHARLIAGGVAPEQLPGFLREFWDLYLGTFNAELAAWLRARRPRHGRQTPARAA